MRLVLAVLLATLACSASVYGAPLRFNAPQPAVFSEQDVDFLFERWMAQHNKLYANAGQQAERRAVFANNLREVSAHNARFDAGLESFTMAMNKFADLTTSQWRSQFLGGRVVSASGNASTHGVPYVPKGNAPKWIDWREKKVTEVKDQGNCGSCWAFSAVLAAESVVALGNKDKIVSLSEQEVVDCVKNGNLGCNGGDPRLAYDYMIDKLDGQFDAAKDYPYKGKDTKCAFAKNHGVATLTGFQNVKEGSEDDLIDAVANTGPVSICVDVEKAWMFYERGVLKTKDCSSDYDKLNHCVVLDGYDRESFLVRNSWGDSWGEDGYIRVGRGSNMCGVATEGTVPLAAINN